MTGLIITIIILVVLIIATGWIAYAISLRVIANYRRDRDQYKKAMELANASYEEATQRQQNEVLDLLNANNRNVEAALAQGKNEGKRAVLDWIKTNVDAGSIEVKIIGTPIGQQPEAAPAQTIPVQ